MTKKYVPKNTAKSNAKDEQTAGQRERHSNTGLFKGYSFANHSHGRTNIHAIGFNHEPGTL
ncbi:hypothetical protein [Daejeonella sp. H1SJ63]|jgi:hypothetical protein|uniref:hypothetical protein n=1 Tax=Daejeonella sp. H1SJ63 TaxID=3034145 RepID=UPI0023EAAA2A|nr:hypothetical protein [Daejeonella sp. H1SJ63]